MQALLLPLADDRYALELGAVREVVPRPTITRVPLARPAVLGLMNLRGEIVPVLDTAALLGLGPGPPPAHVAIAETSRGPAGLTADAVPARVTLGAPAGPAELPAAVSRFAVPGGVATLLDAEALVARLEPT